MADLIQIKGGVGNTPTLQDKELGYNRTEKALYIGTPSGNVQLCKEGEAKVFYAVYGVTTWEEINAAYVAGKYILCKLEDGRILNLVTDWQTGNGFTFSSVDYFRSTSTEVQGSEWAKVQTHQLVTKEYVDGLVATINTRLTALETK